MPRPRSFTLSFFSLLSLALFNLSTTAQPNLTTSGLWLDYSGPDPVVRALQEGQATPKSLATKDIDSDGVPDLLIGYRMADDTGAVAWLRGSLDTIYPNHPEARRRQREGTLSETPFLPTAHVLPLPRAADFIAVGDFDADGFFDVVAADRGGDTLVWRAGDGIGRFGPARQVPVAGAITALAAGEVNRRDGFTDLVVAVEAPGKAWAQVFEGSTGALRSEPELLPLSGPATTLALGRLDEDHFFDIAVASGREVQTILGRDRRLGWPRAAQDDLPPARIERIHLPFSVTGIVIDHLVGDLDPELALRAPTGEMVYLHATKDDDELRLTLRNPANELHLLTKRGESWSLSAEAATQFPIDPGIDAEPVQLVAARFGSQTSRDLLTPKSLDGFPDAVAALPARLNDDALSDFVVLTDDPRQIGFVLTRANAIFIVNTTDDLDDGVCDATHCSLREAILAANGSPGADRVEFDIAGGGLQTILPTSVLPSINETLALDGTTQPGFSGRPIIEISGTSAGVTNGLRFLIPASSSLVRSLVIRDFQSSGIRLEAPDGLVEGSFVGTDASGLNEAPNATGIFLAAGCLDCQVGGTTAAASNLLSANLAFGIQADTSIEGYSIFGNVVGATIDGLTPLGNSTGLQLGGISATVGGPSTGEGNVISGNNVHGVLSFGTGAIFQGNRVGVDGTGSTVVVNGETGFSINGVDQNIGGTSPTMANILSGNGAMGIDAVNSPGLVIKGNYVGTNPSGDSLGNGIHGVSVRTNNSLVGGLEPGSGNDIAFNLFFGINQSTFNSCYLQNTFRSNVAAASSGSTQARPLLTRAARDDTSIEIDGTQTGSPNEIYRIDFFANSDCHHTGFGEGERYLGFTEVSTDATGEASFQATLEVSVAEDELVTATGSLLGDTFVCETSAFSLCQAIEALPDPTAPELVIPSAVAGTPGFPVTVPVEFLANGRDIAATAFSIDFDQTCLSFDPTDADADGIPDAIILSTPADFAVGVSYDGADADGELDIVISDGTLPFATLPDGTLLTVDLTPTCDPLGGPAILAPVGFSDTPAASWGDTSGESVPGSVTSGSVEIFSGSRGDCNGDGTVDAGDLTALTLELFDGDGDFWLDVSGGTFAGDPVGCDANADTVVDAGDTVCTTLLIFGGTCSAPEPVGIPRLHIVPQTSFGSSLVVSIDIDNDGYDLSGLVFSLDLDPGLIFDPTDSNNDGIPDSVTFLTAQNQQMIRFDPSDTDGELDILFNDLAPTPTPLAHGALLQIELARVTPGATLRFSTEPAGSFGSTTGWSVEGVFGGAFFSDGFESGDLSGWPRSQP